MTIPPRTRLGSYEVGDLLGVGGMGEVYRARDLKLGRSVALKILPNDCSLDAERRSRFDREARLLASLNHPAIAAIYGVEDTPDGVRALVLELVEGATLADRLATGPLPLNEALVIARQIIDALDAAHERGIVHRDLKPANIKAPSEGHVKVLDFGLAKLAACDVDDQSEIDLSHSPTITSTRVGTLLGTAAYMSPEQARGLTIDKRTDIWAFGCVLYEMLSGRPAFPGDTVTDILAAIVQKEPDWSQLPAAVPLRIQRLLRRCLEKDRRQRLRDIADARVELDETAMQDAPQKIATSGIRQIALPITVAVVTTAVLTAVATRYFTPSAKIDGTPHPVVTRLQLAPSERLTGVSGPMASACGMADCGQQGIALSPDGRRIVYAGIVQGKQQLFERDLDRFETRAIPNTDGALGATFSPDGRSVAFIADRKVKTIALDGGAPQVLADFVEGSGISWGADNRILYSPGLSAGIWAVSTEGGKPTALTRVAGGENQHRYPEALPDGKGLLYSALSGLADAHIYAQSLQTGERHQIGRGVNPRYLASGHLIYALDGTLFAVPFDVDRLEAIGNPTAVLQGVWFVAGAPQVSFSQTGTMIYVAGPVQTFQNELVWVDLTGREQPTGATGRPVAQPRLSPDGRQIVVALRAGSQDLWAFDLSRATWSRVTYDSQSSFPVWYPDGSRVAYGSGKEGATKVFQARPGTPDTEERLVGSEQTTVPISWSPDGKSLAYVSVDPVTAQDIWVFTPGATEPAKPFLRTSFREGAPAFSPDSKWIAYVSDESGRNEVYVRPYPAAGDKWTISTDGGTEPVWARGSHQLFYRRGTTVMVVDVTLTPTFSAGKPRELFDKPYELSFAFWPNFDVSADGRRLLMIKPIELEDSPGQINVVLNWLEELKSRVPLSAAR